MALPDTMKRAMAKQAEAERERRAKIVNAEGEFQAAEKMVQAAAMISKEPIALQLRYPADHAGNLQRAQHDHVPADADRLVQPFLKK